MPARDIVGQDPWIRRTILGPRSLAERVWRVKERLLPTAQFGWPGQNQTFLGWSSPTPEGRLRRSRQKTLPFGSDFVGGRL